MYAISTGGRRARGLQTRLERSLREVLPDISVMEIADVLLHEVSERGGSD